MSYPTVTQLRQHEQHALKMAAEYRSENNHEMADRREEDARYYDFLARREEWRLEHLNPKKEAA